MGFDRYFSGNIIEQIKKMGYEGSIPEDIGEQYILKNRLEGIKQSEQNKEENNAIYKSMKRQQENTDKKEKLEYNGLKNKSKTNDNTQEHIDSKEKDKLILNIDLISWKGHENLSLEQLIDLDESINNYFKLYDYCLFHEIIIPIKQLTKYTIKNLKKINQEFEKSIIKSNRKRKKNYQETVWGNNPITSAKDIERAKIKKQIKKFLSVNIDQIKNSDLLPLKNRIEQIKTFKSEFKVSDMDSANLLILNHELESYSLRTEITIESARKSINCHKSRKILKEKYPEITLPDNCKELLKLYDKKMKPKDFPDMIVSQETVNKWTKEQRERGDGRSGEQLSKNTEDDLK